MLINTPTCVDEVLISDTGVVDVMDGARQDDAQLFEVREHVLSNDNPFQIKSNQIKSNLFASTKYKIKNFTTKSTKQ